MKVKSKNILPLCLLWLFLYPTTAQFLHQHHDEIHFHAAKGVTLHTPNDACPVCDFHFSLFSGQPQTNAPEPSIICYGKLVVNYAEPCFSSQLQASSVRGPPAFLAA